MVAAEGFHPEEPVVKSVTYLSCFGAPEDSPSWALEELVLCLRRIPCLPAHMPSIGAASHRSAVCAVDTAHMRGVASPVKSSELASTKAAVMVAPSPCF